ncbi:MAG: MFS transporter [Ilumatobacter sp.]|uniref:MFS transporter n=1 Tax=Ilumatobacter sp. TaxID=1967498 RepID=UPI003297227F
MSDDGLSPSDRRALASVAVQFFVNGALFASFVPRLPEIRDRIEIGNDALGRLLAIGALSGLVGSALVGRAVERFGTRNLLWVAGVCLCSSLSIVGLATAPAVLVIGLASLAIFDVLVDTAMNLQGSWISGRRRAPVMNRLHGLWSLGTVVGGVAASQLAGVGVTLRVHLLAVSAILLVVVIVVGAGLLRTDEHASLVDGPAADGTGAAGPMAGTPGGIGLEPIIAAGGSLVGADRARRRFRGPLLVFALVGGCSIAMELTSSDWAAIRLTDDFGASAGIAGLAYVAFTVGMTIGRFGGDSMIFRFGHQRVADIGIVVTIVGLVVAAFVPNQWIVVLGYLAAGLGIATQFPKLYDDAAKHPGRPGVGLGALTGGSRVALLVTPIAVGTLATSRLSVGAATAILTVPAAAVFVVATRRSA